jgi:hypothetical protein
MTKYLHMENDTQTEKKKNLHCSLPKTGLDSIIGPRLTRVHCAPTHHAPSKA